MPALWPEKEFKQTFWATVNILSALTRKFSPGRPKRKVNYTQPKHSRRRRQ